MSEIEVKSLIIESATKFFSKFGFYKTTMDEIAKHIHKAKGVLYYYFRSKEELFNEVLKQELNAVKTELSKIVSKESDSLVMLKTYMLTRLKLLHKAVNYHETLKADFFEKYHFVKDVRDNFDEFERTQLTYIIKKGKKEGYLDVKNINSTVNIMMMLLNGVEIPFFLQNKYPEYESTIEELASMLVNSLKTQKK
ncbi:MAG TPA: helix-turn-helix domain-containing protein [Candidatus Paceibacterota bacterium]|nr:helix-turn-helix domain-containing protein [Candidatus Paceibacterota bacterium]HPS18423.1 helix-turn-helix domain-containing protein [Bacteroidales bacterium]